MAVAMSTGSLFCVTNSQAIQKGEGERLYLSALVPEASFESTLLCCSV